WSRTPKPAISATARGATIGASGDLPGPVTEAFPRGVLMSAALYDTLRTITTATITTMLLNKGIRRCWMNEPRPLVSGGRVVGPAFTLRFVPVREDLATPESWAKPISTRGAIEEMPAGCIAVADAMGVTSAGIIGDILALYMMKRNVAAMVTDGVVRDREGVRASKLPVWRAGPAAPADVNGLTFVGWQEPIGCGGCAIFPGDIIVCDDDGAAVIPQDLLAFVAEEGAEHERMEGFIVSEVERGVKLPGLYPMNEETKARYAAWKKRGSGRCARALVPVRFEETNVPRSVVFSDADRCAQAIVDSVGYDLRLAVPMSIGKPILIVDALYRLAEANRRVQLTIFTGLTLTLPRPRSSLERRFAEPLLDRLFSSCVEPLYAAAVRQGRLPPNIRV